MTEIFAGLPRKTFGAIVSDPPWNFRSYAPVDDDARGRRDTEQHYQTMDLAAIKALPVAELAAPAAHLFLWTTGPQLPAAFDVMTSWGFRYSGMGFVWIKTLTWIDEVQCLAIRRGKWLHTGLGFTTRKNAEFCLLGRRGNARRVSKSVHEIIVAPRREHSRKPNEAYKRVQQYCEGPYLELFSRESRQNWVCWGVERGKFDAAPSLG